MLTSLWKYRRLILHNSLNDLRNRYRGSVGGVLWNILLPLMQITIFSLIFPVVMGYKLAQVRDMAPGITFVVFLCSGLLAWNSFAESLLRAVSSLVGNAGYLKKLPIPEHIFVAQDAVTGFLSACLTLTVFLVFCIVVARDGPHLAWVQVVPALVLLICFAYGFGLLLSCVNVFFRDVQPLMGVVMTLWFWLTPVVYFEDLFASTHAWLLTLMQFNPAYHFIRAFQLAIYRDAWVPWNTWLTCAAIALVFNLAAFAVLRRLRAEIRDVL
ncbi:MAG: ABC transporter permease [Phycisphaerae bacterium]